MALSGRIHDPRRAAIAGEPPARYGRDGEDPDIAGPFAAAPGVDAGARRLRRGTVRFDATDRLHASAPPSRSANRQSLDPETRAELDEIRRELLEARALLDALLRRSENVNDTAGPPIRHRAGRIALRPAPPPAILRPLPGISGRSVAQPGSASAWGAEGREFESHRSDHFINGLAASRLPSM